MRSIFTLFTRTIIVLLCLLGPLQALFAQTHTPKTVAINAACGGYWEYLPVNYSTTTGKYPLLIYISGGNGALGNGTASSMQIILNQGMPRVINQNLMPKTFTVNGETTSFIMISPQFRYKPSPQEVNNFIDYIVNAYPRIDRERICLTGFSIGGDVAWKTPYDLASASRLAALVPVAGYNNPYSDANAQFIAEGKLPVWAIHSNADAAPVSWTISMVNKINSYNPAVPPVLSRPDGLTHEQTHVAVYDPGYKPNGLNIYEWCLQFRRRAAANTPVVNAGTDKTITLPVNSLTLAGSATDADGGTLTYAWTKISGPASSSITSPGQATTTITALTAGDYQFQLEVTDQTGLKGKDTVKVTVLNAPNQLPIASAGQNQTITLPVNSVTLNSSGSRDPDGNITAYNWTKISGPASFTISNAAAANPVVSGLTAGTYAIQLIVTDNNSATARDTMLVIVNPAPNQAPVANAGTDITITLPVNSATLNGSASSDPDGTIAAYSWTKESGPASFAISNPAAANPVISNLSAGTYSIRLTVTDNTGATSSDIVSVIVNPAANRPPVANAGTDISVTLPQNSITLNGSASADPDGNITSYNWTKQSGPASFTISNAGAVNPVVNNLVTGTYTFQLTVTDNNGATSTDLVSVIVNPAANVLPMANAGTDISITLPQNTVTLNGSASSDPDGSISAYQWTQIAGPGNSTIANASAVTTTASALIAGTYRFELVVRDNANTTAKDTVEVVVKPAAPAGSNRVLKVNIYAGSNPAGNGWNNWNVQSTLTLSNAKFADGSSSGISVSLSASNAVADNGNNYPVTMCPVEVGRSTSYSTILRNLVISGLDNTRQYELEVYSSRAGSGNTTRFTIGTKVINVVSSSNYANKALFGDLTPAAGQIRLIMERLNTYNYINGFTLTELGSETDLPNQVPVASAGVDRQIQLPVNSVQLNAGGSADSDGSIVSYNWTKLNGPASYAISNTAIVNPVISNLVAGVYAMQLTVTDDKGATAKDTVTITVEAAANQVPVANAGTDVTITLPQNSVNLTSAGSTDTDGSIVSYSWTKLSGPASFTISNGAVADPIISNLVAGTYIVELTVTDDKGASAKDAVTITVNPAANLAPVANSGNDVTITLPGNTVTLSASGSSDPDGSITSYSWTKLSGPASFAISSATVVNPVISNLVAGTYAIQLTVTDNIGAVARDTLLIFVNAAPNVKPVANAGANQSVNLPANTITLNGGASADADGSIVAYQWRQISGPSNATLSNATSAVATASNLIEGLYSFELTVRDNNNADAKDTATVTVNAPLLSEKIIKVNVYGGSFPAGAEWNNWNVQSNLTFNSLKYADGTASTVSVSMNISNAIADNGANYPVTMCPVEVGRTTSYSTVARFVTLTGLDNSRRYELEVYGSRNGTGNSTKYSIGSTSITILTDRNYTNKAVFTNITPVGGQVRLSVERLNTYNYLNGFILREVGSEEALMTTRTALTGQPAANMLMQEDVSGKPELGTYPNPFRDNLDVQVNNDRSGVMNVIVVNQAGLPVKQTQFVKEQGLFRRSISLQDLQPGVYFLRVQMQNWSKSEKIVKMK